MTAMPSVRPLPTLLGAPQGTLADLAPGDVCLMGLFMDHGGRFGARFAARQLRYASIGRTASPNCRDIGDLNVFPLEPDRHNDAIRSQVEMVVAQGGRLVVVGGDADLSAAFRSVLGAAVAWDLPDKPPVVAPGAGLTVDAGRLVHGVPRWIRPLTAFRAGLDSLGRPGALHLRGIAPALGTSDRWQASLGLHLLACLVDRMAGPQ